MSPATLTLKAAFFYVYVYVYVNYNLIKILYTHKFDDRGRAIYGYIYLLQFGAIVQLSSMLGIQKNRRKPAFLADKSADYNIIFQPVPLLSFLPRR